MKPSLRSRVRAGEPEAFGELFDEQARSVYNLAYRLTGNWSQAEEIVSLTFLQAWRNRECLNQDDGPIRPWLFAIAVNVTRNLARAARRHAMAMSRVPPPSDVPDFAEELAERIDDAAELRRLGTAIAALRQEEREVLALCVWSGMDYATAAATLGIPVGTVRSRLSRARNKLRKHDCVREPKAFGEQVEGDREMAVRSGKEGSR